jgi:cycloeucalenol cycloisomerase
VVSNSPSISQESPAGAREIEGSWTSVLFAAHAGKRAVEQRWLWYTLAWGGVCGVVMLGGFAERWGDLALLALGVAVALPVLLLPLGVRAPEERGRPLHDTAGFKLSLAVLVFSFALNYTQTPFFFDVLHAHFGFHSTLNIRNNPCFLYLMTVAYFSTYCVLLMCAYRLSQHLLRAMPRALRLLGAAAACCVVAGLETALNANPFTRHLYCFDDMTFALWFGSLVYGLSLALVLPAWLAIDERPDERRPWLHVVAFVLAAVYADSLVLDVVRHHVAPLLTTVHTGAVGLGDVATSCLGVP